MERDEKDLFLTYKSISFIKMRFKSSLVNDIDHISAV
jgi:hypothetical protein